MPWPPDSDQVPPFAVAGGCALVVADDLLVLDRRTGQVVARQPLAGAGQVRALAAASTDGGVRAIILTNRDVRAFNIAIAR